MNKNIIAQALNCPADVRGFAGTDRNGKIPFLKVVRGGRGRPTAEELALLKGRRVEFGAAACQTSLLGGL